MKDFFKSFFATLLALAVAGGVAFVLLIGVVAAVGSSGKPTVPSKAVLVFDLDTSLVDADRDAEPGEALSEAIGGGSTHAQVLPAAIEALDRAAADPRITGLFLTGSLRAAGPAQLRELREAIQRFKAKKPVLAYNLGWSKRDYYLAAGATTVIINPFGEMELNGLASEPMFYGEAFKKYGVEVQVTRVGKYKSAVEPFILDRMSDANREQIQKLLDDLWSDWKETVAADRKKTPGELQTIADDQGLLEANEAKRLGLVDRIAPYDEVLDELKKLAGKQPKDKDFPQITLATYAGIPGEAKTGGARIAVVVAEGEIVDGEGDKGEIGGSAFARELRALRQDESIVAVVLRVNSPGGSASAAEEILRELRLLKETKHLVISMGTYAASGGYWISAYGDRIFTEAATVTGSIGVFGMQFNVQELGTKVGVTWDRVQTGALAGVMSNARPKSAVELAVFQRLVDHTYDQFLDRVAEGRDLKRESVHEIAQGRVWSGEQAVKLGLADEIGGLGSAIACAAKLAEIKGEPALYEYPATQPLGVAIKDLLNGHSHPETKMRGPLGGLARQVEAQIRTLGRFNDPRGIYVRMPLELSAH